MVKFWPFKAKIWPFLAKIDSFESFDLELPKPAKNFPNFWYLRPKCVNKWSHLLNLKNANNFNPVRSRDAFA